MNIDELKNIIHDGMIDNYKKDGELAPICFFLKDNKPIVFQIPSNALSNYQTKANLANTVKSICMQPGVTAAGMVIEAYAAIFDKDNELGKEVTKGNIKVSECENKRDIILMVFLTPYKEEMFGYYVDPKNKLIKDEMMKNITQFKGLFSGFFKWMEN